MKRLSLIHISLRHSRLHELVVESAVGVLEPSVAMKQGMRSRIGLNSLSKGLENQRVIVAFTEYIGHNTPVTEIQNGAQIEFVNLGDVYKRQTENSASRISLISVSTVKLFVMVFSSESVSI